MSAADDFYSAETLLCAALLDDPDQYQAVRFVQREWFEQGPNRDLWIAVSWLMDREPKMDGPGLVDKVRALLVDKGRHEAVNRMTTILITLPGMGPQTTQYAQALSTLIREESLRAAVARSTLVLNQESGLRDKTAALRECWTTVLDQAEGEASWDLVPDEFTFGEVIQRTERGTHDWVIPGLLERQERLMVIAPEKAGKSVLARQAAMMLAVGQHPLAPQQQVPPMRSLLVDLENPQAIVSRDLRRQAEGLGDMWSNENAHAHILFRPAGLHLGNASDVGMIWQEVDRLAIDLLIISPIYKAYDGLDSSWEEQAYGVQKPLDRIRERFGCAIWMEHHAPWGDSMGKRAIRPIGSSRWARWLDCQIALTPEQDRPPFESMRWDAMMRDERRLRPKSIRRGYAGQPSWVPEWDDREGGFELALDIASRG